LLTGLNAACKVAGKEPLILGRDQAYIGVLVDDLLTRPIDEPYRMFTSGRSIGFCCAAINADIRLDADWRQFGLVNDVRWKKISGQKLRRWMSLRQFLKTTRRGGKLLWDLLKQPQTNLAPMSLEDNEIARVQSAVADGGEVAIESRYEGYLARQEREIAQFRNLEHIRIPDGMDYFTVSHLRYEAKEKLSAMNH